MPRDDPSLDKQACPPRLAQRSDGRRDARRRPNRPRPSATRPAAGRIGCRRAGRRHPPHRAELPRRSPARRLRHRPQRAGMAARSSQPCPHPRHRLHRRIIIVCNEGYSSTLAASLRTLGLNRATDLVDGYQGWLALARSRSRRATRRHRAHPDLRSVRGDHMSAPSDRIAPVRRRSTRSISPDSSVLDRAGFPAGGRCRREVVRSGPGHVSSVIRFARAVQVRRPPTCRTLVAKRHGSVSVSPLLKLEVSRTSTSTPPRSDSRTRTASASSSGWRMASP